MFRKEIRILNRYFENLKKIEFVVTYACTGRCKHCSEGDHSTAGERIDPDACADAVRRIAAEYDIFTVMAFGGEPLLHTDAVYVIMSVATELDIPKRQVITNGYFSSDPQRIREVAEMLYKCGVNDLLISVDAFHQETIPLETVKTFVGEAKRAGIPVRIQPAWLVSAEHKNPYNERTRELLSEFRDTGIGISEGNVIFPEGNAVKYLCEYFGDGPPVNPYSEDPYDVKCISFEPNGDVLDGNIYKSDIIEIIENYTPKCKDK